ncbi:MAG: hypothetical protein MUE51_06070 [Thermoleophilia bacterium]|jgi:hypothetical protein|nr:hypothetical protein [Thermoleophilia bacterium]
MSAPERAALREAVARLEALTARLGDPGDPPADLSETAALLAQASRLVAEILPRAIREAEDEARPA